MGSIEGRIKHKGLKVGGDVTLGKAMFLILQPQVKFNGDL